jgi:hypothetical protein
VYKMYSKLTKPTVTRSGRPVVARRKNRHNGSGMDGIEPLRALWTGYGGGFSNPVT